MKDFSIFLSTLSTQPGVYQYYDAEDKLLYVGKAKNLKKRIQSYFNKEHEHPKTRILVRKIERIETIVVESEFDALLLENSLIKKHQPKYNILLKDDKTYPWICIKNEPFPRIIKTRKVEKDGSSYFGPYLHTKMLYSLIELVRELYPIRTCLFDLSEKNIEEKKYKVCLEYHLKKCLAPCEGKQLAEEYEQNIKHIKQILNGNYREVLSNFQEKMLLEAKNLNFEKAQQFKEKIELLTLHQKKSTVVNPSINNVDVFSILSDSEYAYINFLKLISGSIVQGYTLEIKKKLDETDEELLEKSIVEIRNLFQSHSKEIYVPFELDIEIPNTKISVPKIGDKKRILDLSLKNAREYRLENLKMTKHTNPERHTDRIMKEMMSDLRMTVEPRHIEGFDNSNIQGTHAVSACVVFKDGKPSKKDYRIFNVKTVEGPNDFATMEEVVYRRYKRMLEEESSLPQLIIIDGGKGQLSSAIKSLKQLGLYKKIAILGIAKRLEELFFPNDPIPLYLNKQSETLKVIQHIRNESHRFGITNHRNKRSKNSFVSELDNIKGIGKETKQKLLSQFKSVKNIKLATPEQLKEQVGEAKMKILIEYF